MYSWSGVQAKHANCVSRLSLNTFDDTLARSPHLKFLPYPHDFVAAAAAGADEPFRAPKLTRSFAALFIRSSGLCIWTIHLADTLCFVASLADE